MVQTVDGHDACGAKTRSGKPCIQPAGFGTDHVGVGCCKFHGGSTPTQSKAARTILLDREVMRLLNLEGYDPITDPYTALADLAGETVRLKDILLEKVEELTDLRTTLIGDKSMVEQIDVVFAAYERSLDRCERILSNMARLDLEDRIAKLHSRIDTDAANKVIAAMSAALEAAEITGAAREVTMRVFASKLLDGEQPSSTASLATRSDYED